MKNLVFKVSQGNLLYVFQKNEFKSPEVEDFILPDKRLLDFTFIKYCESSMEDKKKLERDFLAEMLTLQQKVLSEMYNQG